MKRILQLMVVTALMVVAVGATTNAASASPSLTIPGPGQPAAPPNYGSIEFSNFCNVKGFGWYAGIRVYGPYCSDFGWYRAAQYVGYDQWSRPVYTLVCWSTPLEFIGCAWR